MTKWLRLVRGALGMGLTWGLGGALAGMLMEFVDPHGAIVDIWPAVLAYPAFLGGVVFSVVLGVVARRRRFDELSLPQFAGWGALGGLLLGGSVVALALARGNVQDPWPAAAVIIGVPTLGCALAATGTLVLARMAERGGRLGAGEDRAARRRRKPIGSSKEGISHR